MQLTAINLASFGTGSKSRPYSLCLVHRDDNGKKTHLHTFLQPDEMPDEKSRLKANLSIETLENAPTLRGYWEKIRKYFTHSLILCKKDEAVLLSSLLSKSGILPPVFFTLSLRDLSKLAGKSVPTIPAGEEGAITLVNQFLELKEKTKNWETCIGMIQPEPVKHLPKSYTFFDCETADATGAICAIGLIHIDDVGQETRYSTIINPERPMQHENLQIHGITDEMASEAPTFPIVWKEIKRYFTGSILVAHSALAADLFFLRSTLKNYNLHLGEVPYICTCRTAQKLLPDLENHRLSTLCQHFSIPLDHHNAMSDTNGCFEIFKALGGREKLEPYLCYCNLDRK